MNLFLRILFLFSAVLFVQNAKAQTYPYSAWPEKEFEIVSFKDPMATPEEKKACKSVGGEIRNAYFWDEVSDKAIIGDTCIQPMPDSGQSCWDSSECMSRCLSKESENVDPDEIKGTGPGYCASSNEGLGCDAVVTNGVIGRMMCACG